MKSITKKYLIAVALLITACPAFAQKANIASQLLPLDTALRTGKLPNGFTYYIRYNAEPKHRVALYLVNKAGSVLEDEDQRGLAHFMEHMSFNGTLHFPHNELVNYLQKAGVRFGADINAYTSFDETVYQLPLPSDNPGILNTGIEIMHDWAQFATLDPTEIDKERGVVLEEKRLGKGASERMRRQYFPVVLNNSRYAARIPIGIDTVLNNFKRPQIARFYHDWYRPDLQAIIIVGDINADSLVKVIKAKFADLKNPAKERQRTNYTVPLTGKNAFISVTDKEMTETNAEIIIKHPETRLKTYSDFKNAITIHLFNQMLGKRYAELTRKAAPPFLAGYASISDFLGATSIFDAGVTAKSGKLQDGFKALWREVERVQRFGFTQTEFDRAKEVYMSSMDGKLAEKDKTSSSSFVKGYQELFLKGTASPGIVKEYKIAKEYMPGISLKDMNELAKNYISNTNRDVVVLAPEKEKANLPDETTFYSWMKQVDNEDILPYKDDVSTQPLLASQLAPGKINAEELNKDLNLITYTLSNGIKVIIKPTDFKNDQILFSGFAPGGTSQASDLEYESASYSARLVAASGLGNYNVDQFSKFLEGKQSNVSPLMGSRTHGIIGSSTNKDLATTMEMVYGYFTEPRMDTAMFTSFISRFKAELSHRSDDPVSVFSDTVSAVLSDHNPRAMGPSLEKLNQINMDKAYAFYKKYFADAGDFTFIFVGNVDTTKLKPLLDKYLGSLPAGHNHLQTKDLDIHPPGGIISKNVYKGSEPKSTVKLVYSGLMTYSQENRIKLDAMRECLEIRLLERLREDESGVYSPSVAINTSKYPEGRYSFTIQFGCAPQNVDKLIASAKDEVAKLRDNGPLLENLDKWRAEDKTSTPTVLKTNFFWRSYLSGQLQNNEPLEQIDEYTVIRDKITVEDIKKMAAKYLNGSDYIRLVLLPDLKN